jgi:ribosomal protein S18 acetylase RimI-like enzyme
MELTIDRLQTLDDIRAALVAFDEHFPRSISSRVDSLEGHACKLAERAMVYQAAKDGIRAGFVAFYANDLTSATAFLTHLAVEPKFRSAGVGLALMQRCISTSREAGMKRMKLEVDSDNEPAIRFYTSLGFALTGPASPASIFMIRDRL